MAELIARTISGSDVARLDAASTGEGVVPAFQPVVALPSGRVVGFEALARWPALGDPSPQEVFAHASTRGGLDRLDRTCISAAVSSALADDLEPGTMLLINCEPNSAFVGAAHDPVLARGRDSFQLVFEFTERHLLAHPRTLLHKLAAVRADGFAIALDDVGAHPDSLALLDVVCPDIVKLDVALVQSDPTRDQARTLSAVLAHRERTGAVILAEGIETEDHLERAMAVGATLGQGYLFGRPRDLEDDGCPQPPKPLLRNVVGVESRSPFDLVTRVCPASTARKGTLMSFTRHIESQARNAADPPMLLTALQRAEYFTPATRNRYHDLATRLPLVAIFGQSLPEDLGLGLRGVPLDPADPLCLEWTVLTLGPHSAAALTAREADQTGVVRDGDRRFDVAITHNRDLVTQCARSLLDRMR